jgi:2-dehydropantoate 2-reductase
MKVCVYGAGAIGGHLAARLIAKTDAEVSLVARGAHLAAIKAKGIFVDSDGERLGGPPAAATDNPATLPPQDLVVVSLKAPALPAAARQLSALLAPSGSVLIFNNGIPWWWSYGIDDGGSLPLLDPEGVLWRELGPDRVLGGVVYSANEVTEPGLVTHTAFNKWVIGEPAGGHSIRADAAAELLTRAGLNAPVSDDIRKDIWDKFFRNVSSNPLSALTRLPGSRWSEVPGMPDVATGLVTEALAIARALGWDLTASVDVKAIANPPPGGRFSGRSSMLQDVEAGRPMEVEAILGQAQAFGRETGVPTPTMDVVLPLLRALDRVVTGPAA